MAEVCATCFLIPALLLALVAGVAIEKIGTGRAYSHALLNKLTQADLYVWQSANLLHADFERDTGLQGVRLTLLSEKVLANDESVALPDYSPGCFRKPRELLTWISTTGGRS